MTGIVLCIMPFMAIQSTTVKFNIKLKQKSKKLFAELGIDMSAAMNIFLKQAVKKQVIPFIIREPLLNPKILMYGIKKNPNKYILYRKTA